ncbi:MAG: hypothetical protein ACOX5G_12675 [Kiritimatiellia bacterium]|jgi:hypothetical protein
MTISKAVAFLIAPICLWCLMGCVAAPRAKGSWGGSARYVSLYDKAGNTSECLEFVIAEEQPVADGELVFALHYAADFPLLTKRNGECLPINTMPTNVHIRVFGTFGVHQQILMPRTKEHAYRLPGQACLSSIQVDKWELLGDEEKCGSNGNRQYFIPLASHRRTGNRTVPAVGTL